MEPKVHAIRKWVARLLSWREKKKTKQTKNGWRPRETQGSHQSHVGTKEFKTHPNLQIYAGQPLRTRPTLKKNKTPKSCTPIPQRALTHSSTPRNPIIIERERRSSSLGKFGSTPYGCSMLLYLPVEFDGTTRERTYSKKLIWPCKPACTAKEQGCALAKYN